MDDFDEAMQVVQRKIGKLKVRDVLLNKGFGVNIILKELRRKLGLRRP